MVSEVTLLRSSATASAENAELYAVAGKHEKFCVNVLYYYRVHSRLPNHPCARCDRELLQSLHGRSGAVGLLRSKSH